MSSSPAPWFSLACPAPQSTAGQGPPRLTLGDLSAVPPGSALGGFYPGVRPPALAGAQAARPTITLSFVLYVLQRWWKLGLPLALLLSTVVCGVVVLLFQPVYQARAWLHIEDSEPYIVRPGVVGGGQLDRFVRTQIQLLKSPIVLDRVLADPEIARLPELREQNSPLDWLSKEIQVESLQNSELFQIVFEGHNAKHSAAVVNAVLDAYLKIQSDAMANQTQHIVDLLDKEMDRRQRELERLKNSVRALHKLATGRDPGLLNSGDKPLVQNNPLAELEARILESETRRSELETRLRAFQQQMQADAAVTVPDDLVEEALEQDLESRGLLDRVAEARGRLLEMDQVLRADDPQLAEQKAQVAEYDERLAERRSKIVERARRRFAQERKEKYDDQIQQFLVEIQSHTELEQALAQKLAEKEKELEKLSSHSIDLEFTRGELERAEQIYKLIADRAEALKTEIVAPERVRELRRAEPPQDPVEALPYKQVAAAGLATFCFPFVLAVLWEAKVRRIADAGQICQEVELPLLGEVTTLPIQLAKSNQPLPKRWEHYRNAFQESIDYVRTALTLSDRLGAHQVLAVASAVSREGKSSLASQLAVSLAQASQEPVLLVDGDLRAPDLHDWLSVPLEPGLSNLLAGSAPASGATPAGTAITPGQAIVSTWCPNLYFLPAGKLDRPPQLLLGDGKFKALLAELRPSYRYIVVDAPPVLPTSDALIIANAADATLLATMRNVSRSAQVTATCQRLRGAGAKLIGAVLSGVPWRSYAYNYGSYGSGGSGYGYGYGYGYGNYPSLASHLANTAAGVAAVAPAADLAPGTDASTELPGAGVQLPT